MACVEAVHPPMHRDPGDFPSNEQSSLPHAKRRREISLRRVVERLEDEGERCSCRSVAEAAADRSVLEQRSDRQNGDADAAARAVDTPPRRRLMSELELIDPERAGSASSSSRRNDIAKERALTAEELVEDAERSLCGAAAEYGPLARCLKRLHYLKAAHSRRKSRRFLATLAFRLVDAPRDIANSRSRAGSDPCAVRFVALSDTHNHHDQVEVPDGEVLIFAGDFVGNYGRHYDLHKHLDEFLRWLWVQSQRFEKVFFIAGNHETLLDDEHGDAPGLERIRKFLESARNCAFLQNELVSYRGLKLFGSPLTVSRFEEEGKKYYSRAFERTRNIRSSLWASLPEGLDVLITHGPPVGRLTNWGDPLLTQRCAEMLRPPRYHVFGHDHDFLGIDRNDRTVFLNVAQDECLRNDPDGGGCALVFDVEAVEQ